MMDLYPESAEAVAAAAAAHQLIACVFHSRHDGKLSGYGILFSIEIYVYHFLHVFYPFSIQSSPFLRSAKLDSASLHLRALHECCSAVLRLEKASLFLA